MSEFKKDLFAILQRNCISIIVVYSYADACRIITTTQSFRKIYLSLYSKGLCVRGSWRPNRTANILTLTLLAITVSFPFSRVAQPEARGPSSLLAFSTTPFLQTRLVSKTNWLPVFTELYNSSIAHSISPHNWPSECVTSAVFGMACLAGSEVNIQHHILYHNWCFLQTFKNWKSSSKSS